MDPAAGVDRALIHEAVGRAAVKFFYYSFTGADLKVGRVHLLQFPYDRLCGGPSGQGWRTTAQRYEASDAPFSGGPKFREQKELLQSRHLQVGS
jgi:hypothetical protein